MVMADGFLRFRQNQARETRLTGFFLGHCPGIARSSFQSIS
jgi:hypothetical protein